MKILILAIGQKQPAWVDAAVNDYLARFPADFRVELRELKAEARTGRADEAERCRSAEVRTAARRAAGRLARSWRSMNAARTGPHSNWPISSGAGATPARRVAFAIGGPDGLDDSFKREARLQLRLSSLTLPHALARVLLAEQLYRAWSILARHPYHRA